LKDCSTPSDLQLQNTCLHSCCMFVTQRTSLVWQNAADDDLRRRPTDSRPLDRLEPCRTDRQSNNKVAMLSANALVSINVVTLRQTRLLLGWVTVRWVNHLGEQANQTPRSTQPSTPPSGVGKSSSSLSGWVYAGRVHMCRLAGNNCVIPL